MEDIIKFLDETKGFSKLNLLDHNITKTNTRKNEYNQHNQHFFLGSSPLDQSLTKLSYGDRSKNWARDGGAIGKVTNNSSMTQKKQQESKLIGFLPHNISQNRIINSNTKQRTLDKMNFDYQNYKTQS